MANGGHKHRFLSLLDPRIKAQRIKAHRIHQPQERDSRRTEHDGNDQPSAVSSRTDDKECRTAAEHENQAAVASLAAVERRRFKPCPCAGDRAADQKQKHQQTTYPSRLRDVLLLFTRRPHRQNHQHREQRDEPTDRLNLEAVDIKKSIAEKQRKYAQHERRTCHGDQLRYPSFHLSDRFQLNHASALHF